VCQQSSQKDGSRPTEFDYLRIDLKPPKAAYVKSICSERLGKSEVNLAR
jgi:hypothetical protein